MCGCASILLSTSRANTPHLYNQPPTLKEVEDKVQMLCCIISLDGGLLHWPWMIFLTGPIIDVFKHGREDPFCSFLQSSNRCIEDSYIGLSQDELRG